MKKMEEDQTLENRSMPDEIPDTDQNEPVVDATDEAPVSELSVESIKESKKPKGKGSKELNKEIVILRAAVKYLASTRSPEEYKTFISLFPEIAE